MPIICSFVLAMREVFRKIASVSVALLVLFSTMSFSVDMHYCGDHLVDFSFSDSVEYLYDEGGDVRVINGMCRNGDGNAYGLLY